ncbi:unnamed protein product [Rotaria sp. Silwood1]|nr:unnamed protein product [Rotaria sp. Silwood1]
MFRHITVYHQNESNFEITCDLHNTCGVLYRTYSAYKSHIYRQHLSELHSAEKDNNNINTILAIGQQQENIDLLVESDLTNSDNDDALDFVNDDLESMLLKDDYETEFYNSVLSPSTTASDETPFVSMMDIKRSYVLFILQLREEFLLPKNITSTISTYIITLMQNIEILLEKKAFNYSADSYSSTSPSSRKENKKTIESHQLKHTLNDICNAIESITKNEYQFIKHSEKYFGYTSPEEIVVSSVGEVPERGYFVPIERTLLSMLDSQPLVDQIHENIYQQQTLTEYDNDLMFSIRDGYHGNRLDHDSLLIQLYLDDIGLTNPIGSKRDEHKMCMVYFSLEDIPDHHRSKIDFIQLIGICESKVLKAERFFQPIIDNLNKLQIHGLVINGIHHKFSFSTVVADNLAAHLVGGFQSCFNNGNFCRRCYVTYADRNLPIPLSKIKIRTIVDHDNFVQEIINNPNKSPLMGVIGDSLLHDLIGFHPTVSLPGDLMHDFIEGICPIVVMSLLKQASSMRLITYARIQYRMENFEYGRFDTSNRPPPIQVKHLQKGRIVATAAQKLCIFKLFPIIFHDIICHLPSFIVYKVLREILDLVLSYPFRKQWLPVLGDLCDTFHQMMLTHFPNNMIPKVHFVREYERIIYDYGPAIKQWCFRYEACHSYFKKITMRTNNFKNTPKMLATRYCLKQCFKFANLSRLKNLNYLVGVKRIRSTCFNMSMKNVLMNHFGRINLEENLNQCNKLIHENIEFCRAAVYVMNVEPLNEQPVFAQIVFILKMDEKWWLFADILNTISYNEELFAWEIKSIDRYVILDPCQLKYYYKGLDVYQVNNSKYDIDGKTLKMMNSVERISPLIPKFKQQLIFLEEREKLFKKIDDYSVQFDGSFSNASSNVQTSSVVSIDSLSSSMISIDSQSSSMVSINSQSLSFVPAPTNGCLSNQRMENSRSDQYGVDADIFIPFPDNYKIPPLPNALIKDIENGIVEKFGPHCANRQILIDAVAYDLIEKYNLLYPNHKQFDDIGNSIVKYLKLPLTKQNITIWKDALQTKLKRKRFEYRNNTVVQEHLLKYSRSGFGRPVKRKIGETAERDRYKQEPSTPYPTLVCIDNLIHVYVDFNPILSTNSPDNAVALLIAIYTIFELSFDKKSRTIRFLYSIIHEKKIDIQWEHHQISSSSSNFPSVCSTTPIIEPSTHSQIQVNSSYDPSIEHDSSNLDQTTEPKSSNNNSSPDMLITTNECGNNNENTSLPDLDSQTTTKKQRKRKNNLNLDDENSTFSNPAEKMNHQLSTQNQVPLNDITNSTHNARQNKKKRRF